MQINQKFWGYSAGVLLSLIYGFTCQYAVRSKADVLITMSAGFVFLLPVCLGIITVYFARENLQKSIYFQIFAPWLTSIISMALSMLVGMEGTICLIMALPIYLIFSSIGGILTGYYLKKMRGKNNLNHVFLSIFLFLPLISGKIESHYPLPQEIRTVLTEIDIKAKAETAWQHFAVVKKITEPQNSFFYWMGFPKPVEATLSDPGVGGIRRAKFEKGLEFTETITHWSENDELIFRIKSNPEKTPLTTLDPHVVVGGHFFDTLEGKYKIIPIDKEHIKLILTSKYRLSTRFNIYSRLWSDFLMRDIQNNILNVIKSRCERQ